MPSTVLVGAQWGDEGKGKITDLIASEYDYVVRYQGGNNAGHTVIHGDKKLALHLMPSGVMYEHAVPVIGNGDVSTPELCREMYEYTGCDLVMVGRGSYGRPWLFRQIREYLETGSYSPEPTAGEKLDIMRRHIRLIVEDKGERVGMKEARRPASWYLKGMKGAAKFRDMCSELTTLDQLERLIEKIKEQQGEHENEDL